MLTKTEETVSEKIVEGWTDEAIARSLGVSRFTIRSHVYRITRTLGARGGRWQLLLVLQRELRRDYQAGIEDGQKAIADYCREVARSPLTGTEVRGRFEELIRKIEGGKLPVRRDGSANQNP